MSAGRVNRGHKPRFFSYERRRRRDSNSQTLAGYRDSKPGLDQLSDVSTELYGSSSTVQ